MRARRGSGALAAALALCVAGCADAPERPRNVLLVTLDTVRADRVGYAGGREGVTPTLDRLAAGGLRCSDAWTPRGQTWPALASLLTGVSPLRHGVRENGFALAPRVTTLAELLDVHGLRTGAFLANACEAWGAERFDRLVCTRTRAELEGDQSRLQHEWDRRAVDEAVAWIDESRAPFFAWVHLYDPHRPFPTIDELRDVYVDPAYTGAWAPREGERSVHNDMPFHEVVDAAVLAERPPTGADRAALLAQYDAGLRSADRNLGRLVDALEEAGRLDDTLVVVTSDHGEELFDHGSYAYHGAAIHGSTLRVPLVLHHPATIAPGSERRGPVTLLDVAPAILDALDAPDPGDLEGRSFLRGELDPERPSLSELCDYTFGGRPVLEGEVFAWRRGRWRLVWNPERVAVRKPPWTSLEDPDAGLVHASALFDLELDPAETRDLAAERPELVRELADELEATVAELRARERRAIPPDRELLDTLEALGYVGRDAPGD